MDNSDREPEPLRDTLPPPEAGPIRTYGWQWGREEDRRPKLPWIGVFLVVFGGLLLIDQAMPQLLTVSNLVVLAAGLALLILWLLRKGTFPLYAGAFLTASAIPGLLESLNYPPPPGLGTLCYGIAFLFIAMVRATRGGGLGWQAVIGVILVALGGSELALPGLTAYILPILLLVVGVMLLTSDRSLSRLRS
jgi:hypothetical protein